MSQRQYFKNKIFSIATDEEFVKLAMKLFYYQFEQNQTYRNYVLHLHGENFLRKVENEEIENLEDIPFLPIQLFKNHEIKTGDYSTKKVFTSSGTSSQKVSKHHLKELDVYETSFRSAFKKFYGKLTDYCVLGLLPSYLEREGSSLIYMVEHFINESSDADSGFYLNDLAGLKSVLIKKTLEKKPTLLLGVSYALLDLAEYYPTQLPYTTLMETGGMKGKRKEMLREDLHQKLKLAFGVNEVHSEYGMTELLSQAYALEKGVFECPPWMKIKIREVADPFTPTRTGKTGGINIIDLANLDSCAFIETQDLGRMIEVDKFEVLGRFDNSDIRGCNLMVL